MKVLLIEENQQACSWFAAKLSAAGFRLHSSEPVEQSFRSEQARTASATIVDAPSGGLAPNHIVRRARELGHSAPILVISELENWREKVCSLDAGADDFLVKPVRSEEIVARLRALIRRSAGQASGRVINGALKLDLKQNNIWLAGECLDLTRNEYRLLRHFMLSPERSHTAEEIREMIQQPGIETSINAVEVLIARLRRKVGKETIRTIRGIGYRLAPNFGVKALPEQIALSGHCQSKWG